METGIVKLTPELLSLLSGTGANDGGIMPFKREIFVLNKDISGTFYCKAMPEIFPNLKKDMILSMKRDPENEYDPCAIGIYYDSVRIGWVPKKDNIVISRLMDAGKAFVCKITHTSHNGSYYKIGASFYMVD